MKSIAIPNQSRLEEYFNSISHLLAGATSIAGWVVLLVYGAKSGKDWSLFSAIFYGASMVLLYTVSGVYHWLKKERYKKVFRVLDHCSIFIMIAGTYTPFSLMIIGGTSGWVIFGIQWGLALTGILLKLFFTGRFEWLSVFMYAAMGWMILIEFNDVVYALPTAGFWLLMSGGLAYTFGIIFYVLDQKFKFAHFIWHLFVVAGGLLHFLSVILYVL